LTLALLLLLACGRDPLQNFGDARIEAVCAFYERCGTLEVAGYLSADDCRTELAGAQRDAGTDLGCQDFSQGSADACVAAWDDADCEAPPDLSVCEDVCSN
jgi:hypothetical protein